MNNTNKSRLIKFKTDISSYDLPEKFTFPFYYDPHPLCLLAVEELQNYIKTQTDWKHNFGVDKSKSGLIIGKMFGVLVVEKEDGQIGYLTAFSGKLAGSNSHDYFVPPVFDMLVDNSFFLEGEKEVNALNAKLESLLIDEKYLEAKKDYENILLEQTKVKEEGRSAIREGRINRKQQRKDAKNNLSSEEYEEFQEKLIFESQISKIRFKHLVDDLKRDVQNAKDQFESYESKIDEVRVLRKEKSNALQKKLFAQYSFVDKDNSIKDLNEIFKDTYFKMPPAGAGECAAPKLLQYAFKNGLKPITMAEFWWGDSPKSEIRKHGHYYPACKGKCEPILGHMLNKTEMDVNPLSLNKAVDLKLKVLFEDDDVLVINKPPELLSVPGKSIKDSVLTRLQKKYPDVTGPLIIHRLDMSTSGIMLIAKTKVANKFLQRQFIRRTIRKRYIAVLGGVIPKDKGEISLPMRLDIDDRPRQLVSFDDGKKAVTQYQVIKQKDNKTYIHFYPISGRTHQLRVHASHYLGLNTPIIGDDLYGQKGGRLYLHADRVIFRHPITRNIMMVTCDGGEEFR